MKNFIIWLLIVFIFIGSVVYFVFTSDNSFTVTYIKFNINPEFIIGVNDKDEVKIYNPLNDDAKVLNLGMFNGYKIEDAMEVIFNKLDEKNYLTSSNIDITVITKSSDKIKYYYDKINPIVNSKLKDVSLVNHKASHEELLAYSNEVSYDIKATYNNEVLKKVSEDLSLEINNYVSNLVNGLNLGNLTLTEKNEVIRHQESEGYFNNYNLLDYQIKDYELVINNGSKYKINFVNNDDATQYEIELYLVLEHYGLIEKETANYKTIEEYRFIYRANEIYGLKNNFYKFS